ncbi:uncharacterized protein LOC126974170 [Leptidea sinapis]|uniref:uncharacterized protein LOC126974170 n=1 Tax=Leptidea sinapis TaxID=189913 RepID=UPI002139F43E|nr:uncharacterized protein LOC126974170 [Leptidea sinapis]
MSVIIRLQNLPWSANALDIRNFFRGLSIPEGGVHIVGGELGDAFIAFSTDEDARQAMMLDGGKIKEIQVKLLLSSRSEMHKVIEAARQSVPLMSLSTPAPAPVQVPAPPMPPVIQNIPPAIPTPPIITPFAAALGTSSISGFGIPGIGNPQEIPQPAVIEPPSPLNISPIGIIQTVDEEKDIIEDGKFENSRSKEKERRRSRSRSRDRDRKDRKRDRRDRSRSRERRRRSRSRDRRDRKRDRKDRSRSRDRSPFRRFREKRNDRKSPPGSQERTMESMSDNNASRSPTHYMAHMQSQIPLGMQKGPTPTLPQNRFSDPSIMDAFNKLQELGKKRNPNAFQGEQNGTKFQGGRGGSSMGRGGGNFRREGSRFDTVSTYKDCCVVIKNASNLTSYGDVRRFFPYLIDKHGIKMINDNMGRRTGTIYVRFCDSRSKNLALQLKNNELKGAKVNIENLDDDIYDSAVDSFLPYREENDTEEEINHIKNDLAAPQEPSYSVLKLTDLPNFVKEIDIIKAFNDFSLLSITLNDCRITRTKIAFVQFVKPEDARLAFEGRKYMFGRKIPTVTTVSNEEYENLKASNDKQELDTEDMIPINNFSDNDMPRDPRQRRLQNDNGPVPQSGPNMMPPMTQQAAPGFFPNLQFPPSMAGPIPNLGPTPPFNAFPHPVVDDPRAGPTKWPRGLGKYNAQKVQSKLSPPLTGSKNPQHAMSVNIEDEPPDCVLMKGLPREATDRTIVNFLSGTGAVPSRIHLMLDGSGLPSGDCFCEFRTTQEARMAVTKHGNMLDGCRITVDLVMRSVVEEALEGPKEPKPAIGQGLIGSIPHFFESGRGGFANRAHPPFRGRGGYDRGGFDQGGYRGGYDQGRGSFRSRGGWNERGRGMMRGRGRGFGRGRGGFDNGLNQPLQNNEEEQDPALEDFGAPGCVVSMENVPYRASVDDIMNFFGDFELTQDDVIRRYNEQGKPTGDARVAFRTPFDAQRAVKTRNMNILFDRRVALNVM